MKVSGYSNCTLANGEGARVELYVSGCSLHCKGCFSKEAWDFNYGVEFTPEFEEKVLKDISEKYCDGISILGGDPLEKENLPTIKKLLRKIKEKYPEKTVWLWTGRKKSEVIQDKELLALTDVIKSGAFVEKLKCNGKYFGSSNQEIWYSKTLAPYEDKDKFNEHAIKTVVVEKVERSSLKNECLDDQCCSA